MRTTGGNAGRRVRVVTAAVLAVVAVVAVSGPASATPAADALQAAARQGVTDGYPGVIGVVDVDGTPSYISAGVGDRVTKAAADPTAQVRIGSITKTFVAATMLHLEAEGKLSLDDTVDRWLPGVVNANGNDGTKITLRELLNMTSGIPDYIGKLPANFWSSTTRYTPEQLVALGLSSRPTATPGTAVNYTNTSYILAGMVIKAVTGNDPSVEVTDDIITPLGLADTAFPTTDRDLHGNYLHGYEIPQFWIGTPPYTDVTSGNVTVTGAAGAIVSTEQDIATFYRALLNGSLLPAAQLAELKTGVREGTTDNYFALGIESIATPCGPMFAKNGAVPGFLDYAGTSEDGSKQVVVSGNEYNLVAGRGAADLFSGLKNAFCAS